MNRIPDSRKRIPRSVWLPTLLLCYLAGMSIYFGGDLIRNGEALRLIVVSLIVLALIAALYFFLKKKESRKK